MKPRTLLFAGLTLIGCALLSYTAVRAYRLSFTHDESLSYTILKGELSWKDTANHHPLNTKMMGWSRRWLGSREWQLRLPNVVAHLIYLVAGLLLLRALQHAGGVLLGFALLNFDPFMLDFFSLARGYGLALGLSMAALFLLHVAWRHSDLTRKSIFILAGLACASLADLANYTWLNLHLALLGASLIILFCPDGVPRRIDRVQALRAITIVGLNFWFIRNLAVRVLALAKNGELYARGTHGFFLDTVGSLIETYLYSESISPQTEWAAIAVISVSIAALGFAAAYIALRERRLSFAVVLTAVLLLSVAAAMVEHLAFGTEYPLQRTALYYVPIAALTAAFALDYTNRSIIKSRYVLAASVIVVGYLTVHLLQMANLNTTLTWAYDANTKAAMLELERTVDGRDGQHKIVIGNNWVFAPAINYYRDTRGYDWMTEAKRPDQVRLADYDVVYIFESDAGEDAARYTVLQRYPQTGTLLLKVK